MLPAIRNTGSALAPSPVHRVPSFFDRFFDERFFASLPGGPTWGTVPLSMWEDENAAHIEIDAPGVAERDIELTVHDGDLTVRFERKAEEKAGGYDARVFGRFEQRVSLPRPVDAEKVEAKLANGVLSVTCPKSEASKPRKIGITSV